MVVNKATRVCNPAILKLTSALVALSIAVYIVGPPLYWHFIEGLASLNQSSSSTSSSPSSSSDTCPPCVCNCDSPHVVTIPPGLNNISFSDCSKHDTEVSEDTEKNIAELLSEELKLRETEAAEAQKRADRALLEAKKLTSQYQKEADKCNSGMETCEEAREKAEAALVAQKKLTAMWEQRARQKGWKDKATKTNAQSLETMGLGFCGGLCHLVWIKYTQVAAVTVAEYEHTGYIPNLEKRTWVAESYVRIED